MDELSGYGNENGRMTLSEKQYLQRGLLWPQEGRRSPVAQNRTGKPPKEEPTDGALTTSLKWLICIWGSGLGKQT